MPGAAKGDGEAGGAVLEHAYRESYGRAVATLIRVFGDIDLAEEAVQDAFAVAAQRWPETGVPPNPRGWIVTTARNKALDRLRRGAAPPPPGGPGAPPVTHSPHPAAGPPAPRPPPAVCAP